MSKKHYKHNGKAARVFPPQSMRTECANCGAYAKCRNTGSAWLCEVCGK